MIPPVFVPRTFDYPPTRMALSWWPGNIVPVEMDDGNAYLRFMAQRWAVCETFIICEHDVVPLPGQMLDLALCPRPWCCWPEGEPGSSGWGKSPTLSLARFRPDFIRANRDIWEPLLRTRREAGVYQPTWTMLDSWLVRRADRKCHIHGPPWIRNDRPMGALH